MKVITEVNKMLFRRTGIFVNESGAINAWFEWLCSACSCCLMWPSVLTRISSFKQGKHHPLLSTIAWGGGIISRLLDGEAYGPQQEIHNRKCIQALRCLDTNLFLPKSPQTESKCHKFACLSSQDLTCLCTVLIDTDIDQCVHDCPVLILWL